MCCTELHKKCRPFQSDSEWPDFPLYNNHYNCNGLNCQTPVTCKITMNDAMVSTYSDPFSYSQSFRMSQFVLWLVVFNKKTNEFKS